MDSKMRKKIALELLAVAKDISAAREMQASAPRSRKAYGLIRNPQKVIKNMRDKGIALNYDGSLWTYPITDFGVPNYSQAPRNYARNAEAAVSKTKKVMDSLKVKIEKYTELLDDISKFKRLLSGMQPSDQTIEDLQFYYKNDLADYVNNRVRDPNLKSINAELNTIKQKVDDGDFRGAVKNAAIIQDLLDGELLQKWNGHFDFFKKQRKTMMEISRMLSKAPEATVEIATVGTPPKDSDKPEVPTGPKQKFTADAGEKRLVNDLKRLVKLHGVAEFMYMKANGSVRKVTVQPTEIKRTPKGPLIVGYDVDRGAERNFYVNNIQ